MGRVRLGPLLVLVVLSLSTFLIHNGHASSGSYYSGYNQESCLIGPCNWDCALGGVCQGLSVAGTSAQIRVFEPTWYPMAQSGDLLAYWAGITSGGDWVQAGIFVGSAPDGKYYDFPYEYVESSIGSAYHFQALSQILDSNYHTFKIDITAGNTANFIIDGVAVYSVVTSFSSGYNEVFLEAHQATTFSESYWQSLQYKDGSGSWHDWAYVLPSEQKPYLLGMFSPTAFDVVTFTGGCRCQEL